MGRVALAIAYDGSRFEGYARQPGRRTVEGELLRVLADRGVLGDAARARFRSGSRTDRGVSAAWNVVAFDAENAPGAVVAATMTCPEGLHLLSAARVGADFDPRRARRRVYRYLLDGPWPWERIRPVARAFEGRHDFSNFRRADGDKPPHGALTRIRYRASPPGPWIDFEAPAFLWHQVRRIVAAFKAVAERRVEPPVVLEALAEPRRRVDFGVAPAEPLVLVRVEYDEPILGAPSRGALQRIAAAAREARRRAAWAAWAADAAGRSNGAQPP